MKRYIALFGGKIRIQGIASLIIDNCALPSMVVYAANMRRSILIHVPHPNGFDYKRFDNTGADIDIMNDGRIVVRVKPEVFDETYKLLKRHCPV